MPTTGVIEDILGRVAGGDTTHSAHPPAAKLCKCSKSMTRLYSFRDADLEGRDELHNDALVISTSLSNFRVKKIRVDNGCPADVIFYDAFVQLGIDNAKLSKVHTPVTGFSREVVELLAEVTLSCIHNKIICVKKEEKLRWISE